MQRYWAVGYLAEAAVRSGHLSEARALLADLEPAASTTPALGVGLAMAYARAVLAEDDDAEALFRIALVGRTGDLPWHEARLNLAYGSWLRRRRRIADSRRPLRSARDAFEGGGFSAWAERADRELQATGEDGWRHSPGPLEALSPQETQIAQMAAIGLTNREIAERLYLSHRTVASHLYRIFPKLDINSRAQLSEALEIRPPTT